MSKPHIFPNHGSAHDFSELRQSELPAPAGSVLGFYERVQSLRINGWRSADCCQTLISRDQMLVKVVFMDGRVFEGRLEKAQNARTEP